MTIIKALTLAFITLGAAQMCHADALQISLNPAHLQLAPGEQATIYGTVTSQSGTVEFLNSDSFSVLGGLQLDDSVFLENAPVSLDPGASYQGILFTLTAPADVALGSSMVSFEILGGADGVATDVLASADLPTTVTPEPASFALLTTGVCVMCLLVGSSQKRRQVPA